MNQELTHQLLTKNIQDLQTMYEKEQLNLNPGFQRKSVWKEADRKKLIDSIFRNYALPAIFLYKRMEGGRIVYDVIDGKQRIESIFLFMGILKGGKRFLADLQLPGMGKPEKIGYQKLKQKKLTSEFLGYQMYSIIVEANNSNFNSIIDLFVKINSTGKPLVGAEKQKAQFYNSKLLINANTLAKRFESYFKENCIVSSSQMARMKHVELICELLLSFLQRDLLNKKSSVNVMMQKDVYSMNEIVDAKQKLIRAITRLANILPDIKITRFKKISDYYTLVFLIQKFENEGLILTDKKQNEKAHFLLKEFGDGVDRVNEQNKKLKNYNEADEMYVKYSRTVKEASDEINHRRERLKILEGLIRSLFESKDHNRGFSEEQRRIIWHSSEQKKCTYPGCKKILTWEDFTIDHIKAHSKGGKAILSNAALMCRPHNSYKNNR